MRRILQIALQISLQKVQDIRNSFVTAVNATHHQQTTALIDPDRKLHSFTPTTADELTTLLAKAWEKPCMLDPLRGKLMKDCSDTLLPVIVRTVNVSFEEAVVPAKFKQGVLTPVLKNPSLDNELFPSFRPISNLTFISKAAEKVVAARLNSYLDDNNLHELLLLAYKQGHSTETTLVKVQNYILRSIDERNCVALLLLDLSAAFDTVDHSILL